MAYNLRGTEKALCFKFHVHRVQVENDPPPYMGYVGTRDDLAAFLGEQNFNVGAEVGVQRATYSQVLLRCNPNLKLYLVDPYTPFTHHNQAWQDNQHERAKRRVAGKNAEFIVKTSIEASRDFADKSLDFVYIDAMHDFDNVMMDLIHWVPKVRSGGIVSGHDYEHYASCGVVRAVDAYVAAHSIRACFITAKDPPRSWMFVKP